LDRHRNQVLSIESAYLPAFLPLLVLSEHFHALPEDHQALVDVTGLLEPFTRRLSIDDPFAPGEIHDTEPARLLGAGSAVRADEFERKDRVRARGGPVGEGAEDTTVRLALSENGVRLLQKSTRGWCIVRVSTCCALSGRDDAPISSADLGIRNPDLLQAADDFRRRLSRRRNCGRLVRFQAQGTAFDGGEILEQALEHATTATVRVRGSSRRRRRRARERRLEQVVDLFVVNLRVWTETPGPVSL
jgi:hypothetical protein